MYGINSVTVMGNIGQDPEVRYTQSNKAVCNLRLAVTESVPVGEGKFEDRTTWLPVVVWGPQGEACAKHLGKGSGVLVQGRLAVRSWEKDGQKRFETEIVADKVVFLPGGQRRDDNRDAEPAEDRGYQRHQQRQGAAPRGAAPGQGRAAAPRGRVAEPQY